MYYIFKTIPTGDSVYFEMWVNQKILIESFFLEIDIFSFYNPKIL